MSHEYRTELFVNKRPLWNEYMLWWTLPWNERAEQRQNYSSPLFPRGQSLNWSKVLACYGTWIFIIMYTRAATKPDTEAAKSSLQLHVWSLYSLIQYYPLFRKEGAIILSTWHWKVRVSFFSIYIYIPTRYTMLQHWLFIDAQVSALHVSDRNGPSSEASF